MHTFKIAKKISSYNCGIGYSSVMAIRPVARGGAMGAYAPSQSLLDAHKTPVRRAWLSASFAEIVDSIDIVYTNSSSVRF